MAMHFENPLTQTIADFLIDIGIGVERRALDVSTFLPGISIANGRILVDEAKLLSPGDLLHEAGHLAVMPPEKRATADGKLDADMGDEIGAVAWSWAALRHLDIDPEVVFHPHGYKGSSIAFIENFSQGRFVGVPLLQWMGLTLEPGPAREQGLEPFPHMQRWLRESPVNYDQALP